MVPLIITPNKKLSLNGYYPAHAEPKDAIVPLDLDPTFFALKVLTKILPYNSLNSRTLMIYFH